LLFAFCHRDGGEHHDHLLPLEPPVSFFHNILVGIDLTRCEVLSLDKLGPVTESLLARARWLAARSGGRLTYLAALNERSQPWHLLDPEHHGRVLRSVRDAASLVLRELVEADRKLGIDARAFLAPGKGSEELVQQVLRDRHDLVLVGSRDESGLRRAVFGRTSLRLLRLCPCPVWVSRPGPRGGPRQILVASDLGPASEVGLEFGVALLELNPQAHLHVLHVVDYPLDHIWRTGLADAWTRAYEHQVRADITARLRGQLQRAGVAPGDNRVEVHLVEGAGIPDEAILQFIASASIDLTILGTMGRSGLTGFLLGHVAERLLPEVRCSIVAVKARDFPSPTLVE
jgi:universal stress protein E